MDEPLRHPTAGTVRAVVLHTSHDENVRGAQPPGCKVWGGCSPPRPPASYAGGSSLLGSVTTCDIEVSQTMVLQSFFCLCFLSAVVGLRAQPAECGMIQASDIGSETASTDGFIALLLGGADAASRPDITVHNVAVISLAVGTERNMFRWASVFANYTCSSSIPICPSGTYPRTEQFEVECVLPAGQSDPIWSDSNLLQEQRNTPVNPNLTSADLRRDCSFCLSPADGVTVGVPAAIAIDAEFHCAGIKRVAVSTGLYETNSCGRDII